MHSYRNHWRFVCAKGCFILIAALLLCNVVKAQTIKTYMWGGVTRNYIEYVPSTYNASTPTAVLFMLHGLGDTMTNAFTASHFKAIADRYGWILITPQALHAEVSFGTQTMPLGAMWNAGISFTLMGTLFQPNSDVDDSGFLTALLDSVEHHFNINTDSVFCSGFSMGGFMSHRMAIEHGNRFKAIAAVSGTVAAEMESITPVANVNVMHIHGTADPVVGYTNAAIALYGFSGFEVGYGAEQTVDFWRQFNGCNATPQHVTYNNTCDDGLTFDRYTYSGGQNNSRVVFIKVNNGTHSWYLDTTQYDIDYALTIHEFLVGGTPTNIGIAQPSSLTAYLYPNPATGSVTLTTETNLNCVEIYDMKGTLLHSFSPTGTFLNLNLHGYASGIYIVKVFAGESCVMKRLVVM